MKEGIFKKKLIDEIKELFKDCIITKNDPSFIQGIPDIIILCGSKWATLEIKKSKAEKLRPNQDYYVKKMNNMSFSRFVYPENKMEVLDELREFFMA